LGVPAEKAVAPFISIFFTPPKGRSKKGFPWQSLTQLSVKTTSILMQYLFFLDEAGR
jgi:hypothetical protein